MKKNGLILGLILVVVVVGAIGLAAWLKSISPTTVQPSSDIKGEKVFVRDYSPMTGSKDAKVTLVEFGDFQCPACAAANPAIMSVIDKYKSNQDFNFVFRNFPLGQHNNAQISAEAAASAGAQGKFWEMDKLIYERQSNWADSLNPINTFAGYAQELSLDVNKFKEEISSSKYIDQITQDYADGTVLGVNGTPTFFLNGRKVESYTELDSRISELLK